MIKNFDEREWPVLIINTIYKLVRNEHLRSLTFVLIFNYLHLIAAG